MVLGTLTDSQFGLLKSTLGDVAKFAPGKAGVLGRAGSIPDASLWKLLYGKTITLIVVALLYKLAPKQEPGPNGVANEADLQHKVWLAWHSRNTSYYPSRTEPIPCPVQDSLRSASLSSHLFNLVWV